MAAHSERTLRASPEGKPPINNVHIENSCEHFKAELGKNRRVLRPNLELFTTFLDTTAGHGANDRLLDIGAGKPPKLKIFDSTSKPTPGRRECKQYRRNRHCYGVSDNHARTKPGARFRPLSGIWRPPHSFKRTPHRRRKRASDFAAAVGQRQSQSMTPLSEGGRPPSKAAVTFLRETDGRLKLSWISSVMAGVAASACTRVVATASPAVRHYLRLNSKHIRLDRDCPAKPPEQRREPQHQLVLDRGPPS
jgi:hypothetical protein